MPQQFKWTNFYTEFANKLLDYKENRRALIIKLQAVYSQIGMKLPKLDSNGDPKDIDPFTVFGLFNKGISDLNRIKILEGIAMIFGVAAEVPHDFSGIPVLNNLMATFYAFEGHEVRKDSDIDNLWEVFEAAINLADADTAESKSRFISAYDRVKSQFAVRWNLTMGLYWIRPYTFINLDSRNRKFLSDRKNTSEDVAAEIKTLKSVPAAEKYLSIRDHCRAASESGKYGYSSFPELSYKAWLMSVKNEKNPLGDADVDTTHYWLYTPGDGASMWDNFYNAGIMALGWSELEDLNAYTTKEEIAQKLRDVHGTDSSYKNTAYALWQFVHEMKPGDIIYAKRGRNEILGRGIVESDYEYDDSQDGKYPNIRRVKWNHKGTWTREESFAGKTLTDVTDFKAFSEKIAGLFEKDDGDEGIDPSVVEYPPYSAEDFLEQVYMDEDSYKKLVGLLETKKNIILQGAPGVGKTFAAKRLAYSIMGVKDVDRVMMVQFHQSYSYEDFIMGFRPSANGFELKKGAFYNFCKKAEIDSDNKYFFIIDEINRGNLSKIFGELFMLIENDKRGNRNKLQLLYSDEMFYVPENIYIIGMMNTADRSLAMLDYALRRRFAFFDLKPGFESEKFREYRESLDNKKFDALIRCVQSLNEKIAADESLGEGFLIGHSYFCNLEPEDVTDDRLKGIVEYELIPMLKEYWFDEPLKVKEWSDNLRSAVK